MDPLSGETLRIYTLDDRDGTIAVDTDSLSLLCCATALGPSPCAATASGLVQPLV